METYTGSVTIEFSSKTLEEIKAFTAEIFDLQKKHQIPDDNGFWEATQDIPSDARGNDAKRRGTAQVRQSDSGPDWRPKSNSCRDGELEAL